MKRGTPDFSGAPMRLPQEDEHRAQNENLESKATE